MRYLLSVFLLLSSLPVLAQNLVLKKVASVNTSGNALLTDHLGNFYVVRKNVLLKYNDKGNLEYSYSELSDGNITVVDVSDPLKILLFYKDFGKIKYLDNKLSVKKDEISIHTIGYANATLAAISYDGGFWLFDPVSNQLLRFDKRLQLVYSSGNINETTGMEFSPVFMIESNNLLFLSDYYSGIYLFDRYATFLRKIPLKEINFFQVYDDKIIYVKGNSMYFYDISNQKENLIFQDSNTDKIINARVEKDKIYVLTEKGVVIYEYVK